MTNNELISYVLSLMQSYFWENSLNISKNKYELDFAGEHFVIDKDDVVVFNDLKDKLDEYDYLKEHAGHILASYLENKDNPYKIQSYQIFKEDKFIYLETYKGYNIFRASLNPHNSEYIIHELGFDTRWGSLNYCKKYIREQLSKKG